MSIQTMAVTARAQFEQAKRDGDDTPFWRAKKDAPEWISDMVRDAHGDAFPDDYKYTYIVDTLDILIDCDSADEYTERLDSDVDVYTGGLTAWLASNVARVEYLDIAIAEYGIAEAFQLLMTAQLVERTEIFQSVCAFLEDFETEEEAEEETEEGEIFQ